MQIVLENTLISGSLFTRNICIRTPHATLTKTKRTTSKMRHQHSTRKSFCHSFHKIHLIACKPIDAAPFSGNTFNSLPLLNTEFIFFPRQHVTRFELW
ncbi:hypothetical protein CEXT_461321 [Caerostris extrusa]|uniref:Uncharacterized protein n=1 Tax=Caerostris extrusa TaxID=172846 RepID=A0AAV4PNK3_CAEEX|nr:hypothetical protein CEXT_461321 [Caerostris extrusa]